MKNLLLIFFLLFFLSGKVVGQTPQVSPTIGIQEANSVKNSDPISLSSYRDILKEERQLLEAQSEKYYGRVDKLIDRTLWALGLIVAAALGLFYWGIAKTRSELGGLVREQFEKRGASLIQKEMDSLRSSVEEMQKQIAELQSFQGQSIVWIFSGNEVKSSTELEAIHATGLHNVQCLAPANDEDFQLGEPDLVIFSYDGTDEGRRRLGKIVEGLKQQSPPVSLLVYTYNEGGAEVRLNEPEREILKGFLWFVPVNFPATLVAQTQMLIRKERVFS